MTKYAELSNVEFINLLRSKMHDSSWNIGEMVELENRGMEILKDESDLSRVISQKKDVFTKSIQKAMEPYSKQFEKLSEAVSGFKNIQLTSPTFSIPQIQTQLMSSPKVVQEVAKSESELTAHLSLLELRKISAQSSRDWFQWMIFASTLVAAISSVLALALAVF
jgi:hypothetical protein